MTELEELLETMLDPAVVRGIAFVAPRVLPGRLGRDVPNLPSRFGEKLRDIPFLKGNLLTEFLVDLGESPHQRPGEVSQLALRFAAKVLLDLVVPVDVAGRML